MLLFLFVFEDNLYQKTSNKLALDVASTECDSLRVWFHIVDNIQEVIYSWALGLLWLYLNVKIQIEKKVKDFNYCGDLRLFNIMEHKMSLWGYKKLANEIVKDEDDIQKTSSSCFKLKKTLKVRFFFTLDSTNLLRLLACFAL